MRFLPIIMLLLTACVRTITGPDGEQAFAMRCAGVACFQRMTEQCPTGYNIFSDTPVVLGVGGSINTQRDIAFQCKDTEQK